MALQDRTKLIDAVRAEMARVWGPAGIDGESAEYLWLESQCGVTEVEDVLWQDVLSFSGGTFDEDTEDLTDDERAEALAFVSDDALVSDFLSSLLDRYKTIASPFPRR